jgi:hypothetical protein
MQRGRPAVAPGSVEQPSRAAFGAAAAPRSGRKGWGERQEASRPAGVPGRCGPRGVFDRASPRAADTVDAAVAAHAADAADAAGAAHAADAAGAAGAGMAALSDAALRNARHIAACAAQPFPAPLPESARTRGFEACAFPKLVRRRWGLGAAAARVHRLSPQSPYPPTTTATAAAAAAAAAAGARDAAPRRRGARPRARRGARAAARAGAARAVCRRRDHARARGAARQQRRGRRQRRQHQCDAPRRRGRGAPAGGARARRARPAAARRPAAAHRAAGRRRAGRRARRGVRRAGAADALGVRQARTRLAPQGFGGAGRAAATAGELQAWRGAGSPCGGRLGKADTARP